jgi:hypothetical protein
MVPTQTIRLGFRPILNSACMAGQIKGVAPRFYWGYCGRASRLKQGKNQKKGVEPFLLRKALKTTKD